MNNSAISDLNNSTNKRIFKQIWQLGNKHLVIVDESIVHKLGITESSTFFVEQELDQDNRTILMKLNNLGSVEK